MPFFSRVFKSKDTSRKSTAPLTNGVTKQKPQWSDAWLRTRVDPEEVSELLHVCTSELKSRGLDVPFLLLPFRPSSDPSAARTFVRNYFFPPHDREQLKGVALANELKMIEVMVIISVMKWCWARLPGGVVTWDTYEMFKVGEKDSGMARDAFATFIPISVDSNARVQIISDFFDLLAAVAAHGKTNGLGGHKLSRYAGWWAFEHYDTGKGFDAGYKSWSSAADATCHLFFAYLRSLSPESGKTNGILGLPRSLQQLVASIEYPPVRGLVSNDTTKVVMIVDVVSPTPYALLRRAKNFEYRDDDSALQEFASYDDPVKALTDECRRVLKSISSTNQSHVSNANTSTSLVDPSWSRFEDIGFSGTIDEGDEEEGLFGRKPTAAPPMKTNSTAYYEDLARPTTPSWADFLSSGFVDENGNKAPSPILLPPDKILPPISTAARGQSSQSHRKNLDMQANLDPGELASITKIEIDDAFWWVWISSLAGEEPTSRKAVFGRCALIETVLPDGRWMVMEEQIKGAAPEPAVGAYIAEKKSFLGFTTKRGRLTRRRSGLKKSPLSPEVNGFGTVSRTNIAPDQQARIQQAAAELARKKKAEENAERKRREGSVENLDSSNRNSVFTLGPLIKDEASPALKWASQYDKKEIRAKYLGDSLAGKGSRELLTLPNTGLGLNRSTSTLSIGHESKELPAPPSSEMTHNQSLPMTALPVVLPISPPAPVAAPPAPPVQVIESTPLPSSTTTAIERQVSREAGRTSEQRRPVSPPSPKKLRKSIDGRESLEQKKSRKNPLGPPPVQKQSGIRRLFGTKKGKSAEAMAAAAPAHSEAVESAPTAALAAATISNPPDSPVETNPAILAARRALEGKPALPVNGTDSPPLSPGHFNRIKGGKSPIAAVQPVTEPTRARPVTPPDNRNVVAKGAVLPPHDDEDRTGPPRTRRDEEYDQLSRVDTNEREHADREFSTFDQGPLMDQPAFVPDESPRKGGLDDEAASRPNHQSVYSAVTVPEASDDEDEQEVTHQASPSDRWAQIRKNAAERAARQSEEHTRSRTETRTDDGDTSGEETIESRVARIKARVAELTGNMDTTRR